GGHAITAVYAGDANFTTSTSTALTQTVNQDTVSLTSSVAAPVYGQPVTFTATVSAVSGSSGTPNLGYVYFYDGSTSLGYNLLNASGQTTYTVSSLALGTHSFTAVYLGAGTFPAATSAPLALTVGQDTTTTVLTSSANPSPLGWSVTFTATVNAVAPGSGTPTGQVTFYDGATALGTGTLNGIRQASLTLTSLSGGGHAIT